MNSERSRAGKAVEESGQSPPLHGSSKEPNPPTQPAETKASPTHSSQSSSKIPQILYEGDEKSKPAGKGIAQKFELGEAGRTESFQQQQEAKLPESYGTGKLLLTARDPHTLFAHWDLTGQQQQQYNSQSADGRLALRAYAHALSNQPAVEAMVEPDSRHLFLHVETAGASYVGELGYYQPDRQWKTVATSGPATTPRDAPSPETRVVFSTPRPRAKAPAKPAGPAVIPVSEPPWPFESEAPTESEGLQQAELLLEDAPPFVKRGSRKGWSPVQERLLAEMIRVSTERREWISSAEIMELIRREVEMPLELGWPFLPGALVNISSPTGEQWVRKGFWFNINAELIIYGATEPNAQVTLAGRPITLRPDGTFSFHFALPDGNYKLATTAISAENELRQATLNFSRHTQYSGEVGMPSAGSTPQNPSLEPPPQAE
jgi:Uncharacterized protein conserved in bacteria